MSAEKFRAPAIWENGREQPKRVMGRDWAEEGGRLIGLVTEHVRRINTDAQRFERTHGNRQIRKGVSSAYDGRIDQHFDRGVSSVGDEGEVRIIRIIAEPVHIVHGETGEYRRTGVRQAAAQNHGRRGAPGRGRLGVGGTAVEASNDVGYANHDLGARWIVRGVGGLECNGSRATGEQPGEGEAGEKESCTHRFQATVEP